MSDPGDLQPFRPHRIQADGGYVTLRSEKGDVEIVPVDPINKWIEFQTWTLEPAISDSGFGFRGNNGKYLGVNNYGHVGASVDAIRGWERFSFEPAENGYYFVVYWKDSKHYLFKPPNEVYLEATPHVDKATPMTIENLPL